MAAVCGPTGMGVCSDFATLPIAAVRFFAQGVGRVKDPMHYYDVMHDKAVLVASLRSSPTNCTYKLIYMH
jgi:hypothetical protein